MFADVRSLSINAEESHEESGLRRIQYLTFMDNGPTILQSRLSEGCVLRGASKRPVFIELLSVRCRISPPKP